MLPKIPAGSRARVLVADALTASILVTRPGLDIARYVRRLEILDCYSDARQSRYKRRWWLVAAVG